MLIILLEDVTRTLQESTANKLAHSKSNLADGEFRSGVMDISPRPNTEDNGLFSEKEVVFDLPWIQDINFLI